MERGYLRSELFQLLAGNEPLPENSLDVFVISISQAKVKPAALLPFARQVKPKVHIDCTGLGGHDLEEHMTFAFILINMVNRCIALLWRPVKLPNKLTGQRATL